ncbi:MAG TPA: hypothetical protein P5102_05045 [Candidatus Competibacteraceae bacterium]|nr:hypothetical protein [Candidatus Competibacteraceae bacterium]HRZ05509.1 hypothetical protein [Candidatus Competibacteraceae bacterium]HSA45989.1 hypothetical protein [Candidatus Competibacteraceae bacterium]
MNWTGVAVPVETLSNIQPNTILVVISDDQGKVSVVKVDPESVPTGTAILRVTATEDQLQSGCWVRTNGSWKWKDPCPY